MGYIFEKEYLFHNQNDTRDYRNELDLLWDVHGYTASIRR